MVVPSQRAGIERRVRRRAHLFPEALADAAKDSRLVAEAGIDGADREACPAGNLRDRNVCEAPLDNQLFRGVQEALNGSPGSAPAGRGGPRRAEKCRLTL